jgi:hypothetical protein
MVIPKIGMDIINGKVIHPKFRGRPSDASKSLCKRLKNIVINGNKLGDEDGKLFALRKNRLFLRKKILEIIPALNIDKYKYYFIKYPNNRINIKLKSNYNANTKRSDINKINANKIYQDLSKSNIGNAIVLDDTTAITSKILNEIGFDRNSIFVANPDKYIVNSINTKKLSKAFHMWLTDLLDKLHDKGMKNTISSVWFDYCRTLSKHIKDIEKYFSYKLPKNESIFGVTWSYREKGYSEEKNINIIKSIAWNNGYKVKIKKTIKYRCVVTIFFRVRNVDK